jgi:3-methylcrotonyl-CoA carboxylase alpha subunit
MRWVIRGGGEAREVNIERNGDSFEVEIDGRRRPVELERLDGAVASLRFPEDGRSFQITYQRGRNGDWRVAVGQREFDLSVLTPAEATQEVSGASESGSSRLTAPIPGKVVAIKIAPGDEVSPGQPLIVLEAMKMENELSADRAGKVAAVHTKAGDTVEGGELLVELE